MTNRQGKPYPSAGFTAVYVMAHEDCRIMRIDLSSLIIITNMIYLTLLIIIANMILIIFVAHHHQYYLSLLLIIISTMILITLKVGHNLGMHHDSTAGCAKDGFIMSPSRGTKGSSWIFVDHKYGVRQGNLKLVIKFS